MTDTSFTGRDELWSFAYNRATDRFWLGHGYGAFWDVGLVNDPLTKLEPGTWLGDVDKGIINQAHNGYLELWLHIGLPATILAVVSVFHAIGAATGSAVSRAPSGGDRAMYAAVALILGLYILHNFTEATLMMRGSPYCNLALVFAVIAF